MLLGVSFLKHHFDFNYVFTHFFFENHSVVEENGN